MKFINKLKYTISFGGIELLILKLFDVVFKSNKASDYIYRKELSADPSTYPDLLCELYGMYTGNECNLDNPSSFGEKIQQWKLSDDLSLEGQLSDKYEVRKWVESRIGSSYLIPSIGVWDSFDEIPLQQLPNSFVLKANHGSGWNIIVKDKSLFDIESAKRQFNRWLKLNFAFMSGLELQYSYIKPRIVAEEYIEDLDGDLKDYKIHCFNGEPKFIQIIGGRDPKHNIGVEAYVDLDWNRISYLSNTYKQYSETPEKPQNFNDMIEIAKVLSSGFMYVRVDLYNINNHIKFGEMTFTPASGYAKWANHIPEDWWK